MYITKFFFSPVVSASVSLWPVAQLPVEIWVRLYFRRAVSNACMLTILELHTEA